MTAQTLMVQGTASSVGKSLLVTALCRILRDDGVRVAPFKAQNMSNNSYVTRSGGEMGRAQVNQAEAAGIEPCTDMNPILLKPESDHRCQVVLEGRVDRTVEAGEYFRIKQTLWPAVAAALDRLRDRFDVVLIEGAGSPAEINLRDQDIVNMRVAHHAAAPVLLVGDIDRGGVFAHLVGTLSLLDAADRDRVRALVINKFRGDARLLQPGLNQLEALTALPVAGVVPFIHDLGIAEEDAVALERPPARRPGLIEIAVIQLPHISNFDDFDALQSEAGVALRYVSSIHQLGRPDLVILPGTKATISDLAWLRRSGLATEIVRLRDEGCAIIGVCGGHQMLGQAILDPAGVESAEKRTAGLGLLEGTTEFVPSKTTHQIEAIVSATTGLLAGADGATLRGYEIHMGRSRSSASAAFRIVRRSNRVCAIEDGAISDDGRVFGTYIHGLFANSALRTAILANLGPDRAGATEASRPADPYARLAAQVRPALDMELIRRLLGLSSARAFEARPA
jgi:adenosylcobyric acid synthase